MILLPASRPFAAALVPIYSPSLTLQPQVNSLLYLELLNLASSSLGQADLLSKITLMDLTDSYIMRLHA